MQQTPAPNNDLSSSSLSHSQLACMSPSEGAPRRVRATTSLHPRSLARCLHYPVGPLRTNGTPSSMSVSQLNCNGRRLEYFSGRVKSKNKNICHHRRRVVHRASLHERDACSCGVPLLPPPPRRRPSLPVPPPSSPSDGVVDRRRRSSRVLKFQFCHPPAPVPCVASARNR